MDATALPRIRLLPPQLANQIAAGEVVERPASVLKELLENSIDAGARRIEVEIEKGGVGLIRVRDDGSGIHCDDLALAVSPHATSKIADPEDLQRLLSLGFRGEALASIGSVSRLTITSRRPDEAQGWQIRGEQSRPEPAAHPPGTTVEVRDLFYNTPGRRKFLRSESTEFGHLDQVFRRLALSRPEVAFSLERNGRPALRVRAASGEASLERRVADVVGRAFLKGAAAVDFQAAGLSLWGWVATPESARAQADVQYFYINRRLVRDRLIAHALRQAHRDCLPEGRHPAYVLYLELDPASVDVNVHPTKHEVRFREARLVHDFLYRAVREALQPSLIVTVPEPAAAYPKTVLRPRQAAVGESVARYGQRHAERPAPGSPAKKAGAEGGRLVEVLFGRYLLVAFPEGPCLVDAAAAREVMTFDRLMRSSAEGGIRSQPLLVPETLAVGEPAVVRLEAESARLAGLGFDISPIGGEAVIVRQVPAALRWARPGALLQALVSALAAGHDDTALLSALARSAAADLPLDRAGADRLLSEFAPRREELAHCWTGLTAESLARLFGDSTR